MSDRDQTRDDIAFLEVDVDDDGNPIIPPPEEFEAAKKKAQLRMADMWRENICKNQHYVAPRGIGFVSSQYAAARPYDQILQRLIPTWYHVIRDLLKERNRRKLRASRQKVMICGAGASFFGALTYMDKARELGWDIIAIDRARPRLMECGLTPDYTISLDAQWHVRRWFDDLQESEKVFLSLQSHPDLVKLVDESAAELFMYSTTGEEGYGKFITEKFGPEIIVPFAYLICTTTALFIAIEMGYRDIATIGTELGWTHENHIEEMYKSRAVQDESGFWTMKVFQDAAAGFQQIAGMLEASNEFYKDWKVYKPRRLVDCSGGIDKGYPYMPIHELLERE